MGIASLLLIVGLAMFVIASLLKECESLALGLVLPGVIICIISFVMWLNIFGYSTTIEPFEKKLTAFKQLQSPTIEQIQTIHWECKEYNQSLEPSRYGSPWTIYFRWHPRELLIPTVDCEVVIPKFKIEVVK